MSGLLSDIYKNKYMSRYYETNYKSTNIFHTKGKSELSEKVWFQGMDPH
jgi:hypothetical protein